MLEIVKHAYPLAKDKENYGSGPQGKMTPMDILSYRVEEANPYETNLHDCREALMNGLSQVEIEDEDIITKISR